MPPGAPRRHDFSRVLAARFNDRGQSKEMDMTVTTHEPAVGAPQQAVPKEQAVNNPSPRNPTPASGTGRTAAARRRDRARAWLLVLTLLIVVAGSGFAWAEHTGTDLRATLVELWRRLTASEVPDGFALTNGRVEATKVYITTKYQGRIESVLVREGDGIDVGQVVARMDTRTLKAQLRQAEAQIQRAKDTKATATSVVAQREAEVAFWRSDARREQRLIETNASGQELYEGIYAKWRAAAAALEAAKSQVIEAQAAIEAAIADADRLRVDIDDGILVAPRRGRVQYRLAEPGEVLPPGGRVLDTIDLTDVYMLFYLPEDQAGKTTIGAEARLIFDALPDVVVPATVYYVAAEAQFTPKAVETRTERQKLAFEVRARIDPALLAKYEPYVKTGLPGVIYVRLDEMAEWPERLRVKIPEPPVRPSPPQVSPTRKQGNPSLAPPQVSPARKQGNPSLARQANLGGEGEAKP
jgi:HlyD family secretion protein